MNIVMGTELVANLTDKYVVLSLDVFKIDGLTDPVPSFCVIDNMPLAEMAQLDSWQTLHENLIRNYRMRNWNFCEQAIQHLFGKWNGTMDSFYQELLSRVQALQTNDPGPDWSYMIAR